MKKYLLGTLTFILAFGILSVSFLRLSTPSIASNYIISEQVLGEKLPEVEYYLPYEGDVLPDSTLWFFKALRDRIWYAFTFDDLKKSELNLLFSDKRLVSAKLLFEKKKPDIGLSTLMKGEKYMELASLNIQNTDFALKLATSSLKHRQVIEVDILPIAPEDLKPEIIKVLDYSKNAYKTSRDYLNANNTTPPKNPFDGI